MELTTEFKIFYYPNKVHPAEQMLSSEDVDCYIEKWKLHEVVNNVVVQVLREMPDDPYSVMGNKLLDMSPEGGGSRRRTDHRETVPAIDYMGSGVLQAASRTTSQVSASESDLLSLVKIVNERLTEIRSSEVQRIPESDLRVMSESCCTILSSKRQLKTFWSVRSPQEQHLQSFCLKSTGCRRQTQQKIDIVEPRLMEQLLEIALELCSNVTQEDVLLKVIIECSQELLNADRCSLFVRQDEELVTQIKEDEIIRVNVGSGLVGHCAKSGETINLPNAYADRRFNRSVDEQTGYKTVSLLCAPIICDHEVVAVAQLLNKKNKKTGEVEGFSESDLSLFRTFAAFAGLAIHNAELYMEQTALMQKNQFFISVIEKLSQVDMRNWGQVVGDVSEGAREVLQAERCTLFVVDKELNELHAHQESGEIRFAAWKGVAGHVYSTGETLNITHPYQDRRFNPDVDKQTGLITHSLLTMPVKHRSDVIAVVQVVNKKGEGGFTAEDEVTLKYFAHFAGVTLNNSNLYEFVLESRNKAMALFERQLQVLSGPPMLPMEGKKTDPIVITENTDISSYLNIKLSNEELAAVKTTSFNVHTYAKTKDGDKHDHLIPLFVHLLEELNFPRLFGFSRERLVGFLIAVRAQYRAVPYHNFLHAFDVAQTLFTYLVRGKCSLLITELDAFVLMISALLHDADHMGLNNSFHFKTESPLGILSSASGSTSVLEVHHCHVSLQLLEHDEVNIFAGLSQDQSREAYGGLVSNILSTDMSKHNDIIDRFTAICDQGYRKEDPDHRRLTSNMLLKAADISNISKPFEISRRWGLVVTEEFHLQGDAERTHGHVPAPMFDRSMTQELAQGQTAFIEHVGLNLFTILQGKLCHSIDWTVSELENNKIKWTEILEASKSLTRKRESISK